MPLSENANKVLHSRYLMDGETSWEQLCNRVAKAISSEGEVQKNFFSMIYDMKFIPGGRILRNAGRVRGSLFNCYHLPIGDSIEEIGQCNKDALTLWSEGGGVGVNFSSLRPRGAKIHGKGGVSSGMVSFMRALDGLASTIESGGNRRAASIGTLDCSHPEIINFINAKLTDGAIQYFNISVNITHEFLEAVIANNEWDLKFHGLNYDTIQAKQLWDLVLHNMVFNGEPGVIVWDNFIKNNSYYFAPILGPNPCSEATLAAYDVCDLGSLVLPFFVDGGGRTKWSELEEVVTHAVRFLDSVIDVNKYIIDRNKQMAQQGRRIGIGVMGMAEYLFRKQLRYGSKQAISAVEDIMKFIRDTAYAASIKLASEFGSFPAFNAHQYHSASFIRKLPASIRKDIRTYGIRNVTLMALAPTGTISLLPEVTPGIEPLFSKGYMRKDRVGERVYIHPMYKEWGKEKWFVDTQDLSPSEHLDIQVACQKYTDGAVSKTINVPSNFTPEQLSELLLEYLFDLKGVTVYRDGSRSGQVLNHLSASEIKKHAASAQSSQAEEDVSCASGVCEL